VNSTTMNIRMNVRFRYETKNGYVRGTIPLGLAEELMDMGAQLMLANIKLWNPDIEVADAPLKYTDALKEISG